MQVLQRPCRQQRRAIQLPSPALDPHQAPGAENRLVCQRHRVSHCRPRLPGILCHLPNRPSSTSTLPEAVGVLLCASRQQAMSSQFPPPDKKLYDTYRRRNANQLRFPEAIVLSVHTLSYKLHLIYVGCVTHSPALRSPPAGPRAPTPTARRGKGCRHQARDVTPSPRPPPGSVQDHRPRVKSGVAWLFVKHDLSDRTQRKKRWDKPAPPVRGAPFRF